MGMLNFVAAKLKKVTITDIIGIFYFIIMLIPAVIKRTDMKRKNKEIWLVCEHGTGRDNGYVFYRYMKEKHPGIETYYAINFDGIDYDKMKTLGNLIRWGSLKHYFYYMVATWNITSHKNGNPNQTLFTILQKIFGLYDNVIFLQHGVLYQDFNMFHKENCCFRMFVCGAWDEYDFVKKRFGYTDEVKYTGLARFDNLYGAEPDRDIILYIPTWRRWLQREEAFRTSDYYRRIMGVLNSEELGHILKKYNKKLLFYTHASFWAYSHLYETCNENVKILDPQKTDIQELLKKGVMLITDYSSIFTDFAYMEKSILYYHFDYMDYMQRHYDYTDYTQKHKQGENVKLRRPSYFDYERNGFGPVVHNEEELLKAMEKAIQSDFMIEDNYLNRIRKFFVLHDNKNCERIYLEINSLKR